MLLLSYWFILQPESFCSKECPDGYMKKQEGVHKCCFSCTICPKETYLNTTDPYKCIKCKDTEWSAEGSTTCNIRQLDYVKFSDPVAIGIMIGTIILLAFIVAISVLFALNYNTPVVRSAGGPMCFLILGCLSLCSISVFFFFGEPSVAFCVLRYFPFLLFYTVCVACFFVRSFQIICIFKLSENFHNISGIWTKYNVHWMFISAAFLLQAILLINRFSLDPPKLFKHKFYFDRIILGCELNTFVDGSLISFILIFLMIFLSLAGKNFPKNYNEAKTITISVLLLIVIWVSFSTLNNFADVKFIDVSHAVATLLSLYSFLLVYFFPRCYIIIFKPEKNTEQYFQDVIQSYTRSNSQ
ncbi:taste receptor type 1 member 1-like [Oryzias latipes]|uniref:taste receptor type 1 member 1-like n=1 Tax=Oryzias latipes TaxID=8090 RepID=UPI0009D99885|nr:taste receptor type 1 member 1-like [Oryzias latipes]